MASVCRYTFLKMIPQRTNLQHPKLQHESPDPSPDPSLRTPGLRNVVWYIFIHTSKLRACILVVFSLYTFIIEPKFSIDHGACLIQENLWNMSARYRTCTAALKWGRSEAEFALTHLKGCLRPCSCDQVVLLSVTKQDDLRWCLNVWTDVKWLTEDSESVCEAS